MKTNVGIPSIGRLVPGKGGEGKHRTPRSSHLSFTSFPWKLLSQDPDLCAANNTVCPPRQKTHGQRVTALPPVSLLAENYRYPSRKGPGSECRRG